MTLPPGTRIGPYEVTAKIGEGGMGQVYRATDTKLKRQVAIKILPPSLATDYDRLARFQREAEVLASLNHPHIAAIYGLEESGGMTALVMELVEGDDLSQRIARGAIPLDEALPIAKQIAEALEAAHEQAIIHRDLKPANIKVRPDGTVKVLDFGLAKAMEPVGAAAIHQSQLPTITTPAMTQAGMILGTAAYMSPEQARGKPVDERTDIWAFGCVLYEMLTGRRAFEGEDVSEVLARVIEREPDLAALPAATPLPVRRLLRRCLTKDRRRRLSDIVDGLLDLEEARTGSAEERTAAVDPAGAEEVVRTRAVAARAARGQRFALWAAAVLAIAASVLAFLYVRQPLEERPAVKLMVLPPAGVVVPTNSIPAVSPDGRRLVFEANQEGKAGLWLRDLGSLDTRLLPGTEDAALPFWSPDSQSVGFFADGKLKRVDAAGGSVITLCDVGGQGRGGTWNRDGVIVFAGFLTPLYRVSASGGTPVAITSVGPEGRAHRYPWFLPDGRHYLYTAYGPSRDEFRLFVGELDSTARKPLMPMTSNVVYAGGHLLFVRDQNLMAQPFDVDMLDTTGDPVPIAEQISYSFVDIRAAFSASPDGVLAFTSLLERERGQLTLLGRTGNRIGVIDTPGLDPTTPAISPDGKFVAFRSDARGGGILDVWTHDITRNVDSKLTFGTGTTFFPIWAPDQKWVAYYGTDGGVSTIRRRAPNGAGGEEVLPVSDAYPTDWSRDGRYIVYQTLPRPGKGWNLGVLPMFGDRKPLPYLQTAANERAAKLSPNGKWLAYVSDESRRDEVYVQSFPETGGGRWQISGGGGANPIWSRDGTEIFYASLDGKVVAVPVQAGDAFSPGQPRDVFPVNIALNSNGNGFDVGPDGRFLVPVRLEQQVEATPVTVVLNWQAELKK